MLYFVVVGSKWVSLVRENFAYSHQHHVPQHTLTWHLPANTQLTKRVAPGATFPVPLTFVELQVDARPVPNRSKSVFSFSNKPVFCTTLLRHGCLEEGVRQSRALNSNVELPFRSVEARQWRQFAAAAATGCACVQWCSWGECPLETLMLEGSLKEPYFPGPWSCSSASLCVVPQLY